MNPITRDAIAQKLDYMRNAPAHMEQSVLQSGTTTCLDAYVLTRHIPALSDAMLLMTGYPGTD